MPETRTFHTRPCRILTNRKGTLRCMEAVFLPKRGVVTVAEFECRRCHCIWGADRVSKHEGVACSACYSDNVVITRVRLEVINA